jgi:hypothetical protein
MDKLDEFTKKHSLEERKEFKTSWLKWIIEKDNQEMILNESFILKEQGYKEDIISKMFISVRFHLKKKDKRLAIKLEDVKQDINAMTETDTDIKTKSKHTSCSLILLMNNHIRDNLSLLISPAKLYYDFSQKYQKELELDVLPRDIIKEKKAYKNRYYLIVNEKT